MNLSIKCDRCGALGTMPSIHVLPDGWDQYDGDDYCPRCVQRYEEVLEQMDLENMLEDERKNR